MCITKSVQIEVSTLRKPTYSEHNRLTSHDYYKTYKYCRTDIACVSIFDVCNVFFGVDGPQLDLWQGVSADEEARKLLIERATECFKANCAPEYIEAHRKFFAEHYPRALVSRPLEMGMDL